MLVFETVLMRELWEMGFDNGMNCGFEDFCKGGKKGDWSI